MIAVLSVFLLTKGNWFTLSFMMVQVVTWMLFDAAYTSIFLPAILGDVDFTHQCTLIPVSD